MRQFNLRTSGPRSVYRSFEGQFGSLLTTRFFLSSALPKNFGDPQQINNLVTLQVHAVENKKYLLRFQLA
jgi:hypothetical protein